MPPDAPTPPSLEPLFSADVWTLHFRSSPWPRPLDVHTRNRTGETPLMMAAGYQCSALVPLIALGADIEVERDLDDPTGLSRTEGAEPKGSPWGTLGFRTPTNEVDGRWLIH